MTKETKKNIFWVCGLIGSFVAGNFSTGFEMFKWWHEKSATLVGNVVPARTGLKVYLDNSEQPQTVNPDDGFFRFSGLERGLHNLRFAHPVFDSHSRSIEITGRGELRLIDPVRLPVDAIAPRVGPTLRVVAIERSTDGSDSLKGLDAGSTGLGITLVVSPQSSVRGWIEVVPASLSVVEEGIVVLRTRIPVRSSPAQLDRKDNDFKLGRVVGWYEAGTLVKILRETKPEGSEATWAKVEPKKGSEPRLRR